jgi:type VI secretion system protein ImpK
MNSNDPFDPFSIPQMDDRTVIRPTPGGSKQFDNLPPPSSPNPGRSFSGGPVPKLGRLNPLEKAASGLLALITRINMSRSQSDPMGLKNKIIGEIKLFQTAAQTEQIDPQTLSSASYILCTVLDEAIINTPWGNESNWPKQSLLALFHKEVEGGERFFDLLKSVAQNPGKNRYLLELMYICLALGFEGRYRLIEGGKNKLTSIREGLYQLLQKERDGLEQTLSPHWQGLTDRRNPLMQLLPFWVFGAITTALLALIYTVFLFRLNHDSDPVFKVINSIKPPVMEVAEPEPPVKIQLTLSMLLANEIELKQLDVIELAQRSTVTIQSDNLFSSGSSSVNPSITFLLRRIAESLNQFAGQVLIVGHSDNKPIHSARYPSNWHLSKARAEAVAEVLKQSLSDPERIVIEGKSDLEPVASNSTPAGRAKNRRVEITLLK